MYTKSSLFFPLSCFSHKMGHNSYSIWIFVCCCASNFKPRILLFCPSLFQGSFKLLSMSLPFFSFTLGYSSSFQFFSCTEIFPMLANLSAGLPLPCLLHVEAFVSKSLVSSSERWLFSHHCLVMQCSCILPFFMLRCAVTELHFETSLLFFWVVLGSCGLFFFSGT